MLPSRKQRMHHRLRTPRISCRVESLHLTHIALIYNPACLTDFSQVHPPLLDVLLQKKMNQNAAATSVKAFAFVSFLVLSLQVAAAQSAEIPELSPGDPAPPFTLQSLKGLLDSSSGLQGPIVFHAFNNQSGFLEWLVDNPDSIKDLVRLSPSNTHYVFMFYDDALENAKALENKFSEALRWYHRNM